MSDPFPFRAAMAGTVPVTYTPSEDGTWLREFLDQPVHHSFLVTCLPKDAAQMKRILLKVVGRTTGSLEMDVKDVGTLSITTIKVNGQTVWEAKT